MSLSPLDALRIARPCSADWEAMEGTDRVRSCAACSLHVYNLSALSAAEARALIQETEGRRCVRFYRRADGTVLTQDCPGGPPDLARERLNGALFVLALLGLWAAATPVTDATWTLAARALDRLVGTPGNEVMVMGMMEVVDDATYERPSPAE